MSFARNYKQELWIDQLYIEKHGGGMMLLKVLLRSGNYGRSEITETQEKYLQEQKKARRAIYLANIKHKGKYLEALYGEMIRNVIFARFQRTWSKLIKILLVGSA